MSTLYISDLDGTLLTREERISDYSLALLNRMIEGGLPFTYATARAIGSARHATRGLRLCLPAIYYNGAVIADADGKLIHCEGFSQLDCAYLIDQIRRCGIEPIVYALIDGEEKVSYSKGRETPGVLRYLARRKGDRRLRPVSSDEELFRGLVFYVTLIAERSQLDPLCRIVTATEGTFSTIYNRETYQTDYWLEILPFGATKGKAAKRLKEYLGFDRIVCFGDGKNDLGLFEVADERYAVRNADDALKARADAIVGYCEEDGVAKWLSSLGGNY
ncbi:MAG: HAD family hydrolase [Christensenellaceae bacterium]